MKLLSLWSIRLFEEMCEACECEYRRGELLQNKRRAFKSEEIVPPIGDDAKR